MENEGKMEKRLSLLALRMARYEVGCPQRVSHFLKVYSYARHIGLLTGLPREEQDTLEAAALMHDIGIRKSLEKFHSSAGNYQELEGPGEAAPILEELGFPSEMQKRILFLIAHHHTYSEIQGMDYQILVEADYLVNIEEGGMESLKAKTVMDNLFCTEAGKELLTHLFLED